MNKYRKYQMICDYADRRINLIVKSLKGYKSDLAYRASIWENFDLEINFSNAANVRCLFWKDEPEYIVNGFVSMYLEDVGAVTIKTASDLNDLKKNAYYAEILRQLNFESQDIREAGYLGLIRSHAGYFLNAFVTTSFLNELVNNLIEKKLNVIKWEDVEQEYKRLTA